MTRTELRDEVERLIGQVPFQPFLMILVNGDRIPIFHPELIHIDPLDNGEPGPMEFVVMLDGLRGYRSFDDVAHLLPMERVKLKPKG